jgi:hypothetical protein
MWTKEQKMEILISTQDTGNENSDLVVSSLGEIPFVK